VIVNTVHGLYALPEDRFAKRAVVYGLERIAAACSDQELLQNVEDLPVLEHLGIPADRLTVLGNGVDLAYFDGEPSPSAALTRERIRAELGIGPDEVVIGAVGRLVREKGLPELFEALGRVSAERPGVRLVVVGPTDPAKADAITADELRRAEERGSIFAGQRSDMADLYRAFDLYVLASHREGFPRSAMEPQRWACRWWPPTSGDVARSSITAGPACSFPSVTRSVSPGLAAPRRRRQATGRDGRAGRVKARREFDQQRVIDITLATYERALATKRR